MRLSPTPHVYITYGESGRVNDRVNHHYLLQEGSHRAKGVPEHGSQVGQDLSLPTQLNESMFPRLRTAQLLDPRVHLCVCEISRERTKSLVD